MLPVCRQGVGREIFRGEVVDALFLEVSEIVTVFHVEQIGTKG